MSGLLLLIAVLAGCSGGGLAPVTTAGTRVENGAAIHTVRKGETVYVIAFRYGVDFASVARANALAAPYNLYSGQVLRVPLQDEPATPRKPRRRTGSPPSTPDKPAAPPREVAPTSPPAIATAPRPSSEKPASAPRRSAPKPPPTVASASPTPRSDEDRYDGATPVARWHWPSRGKVVGTFGASGGKGIDISGRLGQPVVAAGDGRVVYSGSGLLGYGKLIIVKHNKRYLSAYAHNHEVLVSEGDIVKGGERIAAMGSTGTQQVKLHFEVRRDGKPVNPLRYLPN
ncbi:MAG: peptidoglycan DD-metalloendopeptidase family protein [Ectothiorhodospiraceae bacterium]|nr:peptidoglycan DD-metalloendopeptidase family protein [Chromatiales bacterium]MCP5157384.1 peptidoglycan DD-metalloendopeptidase family protein [Ectothiorhodospiraceae bacterium]